MFLLLFGRGVRSKALLKEEGKEYDAEVYWSQATTAHFSKSAFGNKIFAGKKLFFIKSS